MNLKKLLFAATLLTGGMATANAGILDFETGFSGDITSLGTSSTFNSVGVTFESANGLNIIKVGPDTDGFVPNDEPQPMGIFGDYFLSSDFGTTTVLNINYNVGVSEASFDMADIDGSGNDLEIFTFLAKDSLGNILSTMTVDGNDADAGDAQVVRIGFSGLTALISRIEIEGTTAGGTRKIGIAFDNFNTVLDTTKVSAPASIPLVLTAFAVFGFLRARRKN